MILKLIGEKGKFYNQIVYINGKKVTEGYYNKELWDCFRNEEISELNYFCIGRSSMNQDSYWHYSKMNAYCLRLYSRALTDDEVRKNYDKAVTYHDLLNKGF